MTRAFRNCFLISGSILILSTLSLLACTNNPFNPHAEARILEIKTSEEGRFAGIRQSVTTEGEQSFMLYTFVDPIVTIQTHASLPAINFKKFVAQITLSDGTVMPSKEYPLSQGTPYTVGFTPGDLAQQASGVASIDIRFPIVSADKDLQNVVYPGNSAPRVRDGVAKVTVSGTDVSGHNIDIPFDVNLSFESTVFPDTVPTPEPIQTPDSNTNSPAPTPGA